MNKKLIKSIIFSLTALFIATVFMIGDNGRDPKPMGSNTAISSVQNI